MYGDFETLCFCHDNDVVSFWLGLSTVIMGTGQKKVMFWLDIPLFAAKCPDVSLDSSHTCNLKVKR